MQCEGIANSGKRCLSFEPTHGARFCSTHALKAATSDDGSLGPVTMNGRRQCEGITNTITSKQCLSFEEKPGARFCKTHAYQEACQRLGRKCYGYSLACRIPCHKFVPLPDSGPVLAPFCREHADLDRIVRLEQCQWSDEERVRCFRYVPESNERYFCDEHMVHANSEKYSDRPITTASDDILMLIIDNLKPIERVAFALASTSCANLVRAWGTRDMHASRSSAGSLEPIVISTTLRSRFSGTWRFTLVADHSPNWDLVVTRKTLFQTDWSVDKSVHVFSTLSDDSLAALHTAYRRCMQSGMTPRCRCATRVDHLMRPCADGDRVAMPLTGPDLYELTRVRDLFPYLFHSKKPACCMICARAIKTVTKPAVCGDCRTSKQMLIRWCTACHGNMEPLHLARMFWQTQKPLKIKATRAKIRAEKSAKVRSNAALSKNSS